MFNRFVLSQDYLGSIFRYTFFDFLTILSIFIVPEELRRPPGPILEAWETHPGWFRKDFSVIFGGVCRELAGKVRWSPVLLLRGSSGVRRSRGAI